MHTKRKLRAPIDQTANGIALLFEKMAIVSCIVKSFDNEVTVNLVKSGFTAIGGEIMSYQGEVIFSLSKIRQLQVERTDDDRLILWMSFSVSSQIEIVLQPVQSDDFWNLLKCLEKDAPSYKKNECVGVRTGSCPCCVRRAKIIKSTTGNHPLALMLNEISQGIVENKMLEIELGDHFCRAVYSMDIQSTEFENGIATLYGDGEISLNLATIHSIKIYGEVIDQTNCLVLIMYNSYADIICRIIIQDFSPFQRWKGYLEMAYYGKQ